MSSRIPDPQAADLVELSADRIQSEERLRFEVLNGVYQISRADPHRVINAARFADALTAPLERVFAVVEFLSREGYLVYRGAGPRVALTRRGIDYVEAGSNRRGTLRD